MHFARLLALAAVGIGWTQTAPRQPEEVPIFFLNDHTAGQWCGYTSEARFKEQVQPLRAMVLGKVSYTRGHVTTIQLTEVDETGDWAVNDDYTLKADGTVQNLKRTINIIPEDVNEEQSFAVKAGKAVKQTDVSRELSTKRLTQKSVNWFKAPPVRTNAREFPFVSLIVGNRQAVVSNGEACVPERSR